MLTRMRFWAHLTLIGAVAVPSALAAPEPPEFADRELRSGDIIAALRSISGESKTAAPADRSAAFDRILSGRPYPGTCATPLLLSLWQARPEISEAARALLDRLGPEESPAGREIISAPGAGTASFRLRCLAGGDQPGALKEDDNDLDGIPDEARQVLNLLQEARSALGEIFERSGPASLAVERVHEVEIADLPGDVAGWVWLGERGPVLLLDRDSVLGPRGDAVLRHQITHLLQIALTRDESPWWYEAHAIWAEDPSASRAALRAQAVQAYLGAARLGLDLDVVAAWEGAFLWPHYLLSAGAPEPLFGFAWEEMAAVAGNNTLDAFASALPRTTGTTLPDAVRAFRIWNLFLGDFDDGHHYPFGSDLSVAAPGFLRSYPAFIQSPSGLPYLGGAEIRLMANQAPGGWLLDLDGETGAGWDVSIVTLPARLDSGPRLAEVRIDPEGRGHAAIPWGDLAGVIVVVQNLGGETREPAGYTLSVRHDPLVPFDLMSFVAEEEDGAVALRWSTEREMDLAGWTIRRSRHPVSGFAPSNTLMIPATGGTDPASYQFMDAEIRPGRKYYYLLEGVTREGFTVLTHAAAVRLSPTPIQPETP